MTENLAWNEEPTGDGVSYMVRASTLDCRSYVNPDFELPLTGYVEAVERSDRVELTKPGLYGYIHGWGSYHTPFSMYYAAGSMIWQVLAVRNSEVIYNCGDKDHSCRVPRAWVKFTGSRDEITEYLRGEATPYAGLVAEHFEAEHDSWKSIFDDLFARGGGLHRA